MKLTVKKLDISNIANKIEELDKFLENNTEINTINTINWEDYSYKPDVKFRIAHTGEEILIKFYVTEKNPKATETKINGDVYKDSCVEFFISPYADGNYYNFEFNCIGTPHLAYGKNRHNRQAVNENTVAKIKTLPSLGKQPLNLQGKDTEWNMLIIIPKSSMVNDNIPTLDGLQAKANFYKCGDETEEMHFISWNPVRTEKPDYHRYNFFGDLIFE